MQLEMMQTPEVKAEVDYWNKEFDKCKAARQDFERQWLLNISFYLGKQYVIWAPAASTLSNQRLTEPSVSKSKVRIVANKIKPAIRMELTKLTKEEPHFSVTPATTEPTDVAASKVAESIAEYYLHELKYSRVRRSSTFWMLMCGSAFIKPFVTSNGMEVSPQIDAVSAFNVYVPDVQEESIEKQAFIIHGRAVKTSLIEELYDIKIGGTTDVGTNDKLKGALDIKNDKSTSQSEMSFLKEIWIKPCKKYPSGGMLVIVNQQLVYVEKPVPQLDEMGMEIPMPVEKESKWSVTAYPYSHKKYPFLKIDHIPSGRFYGLSVIEDLIPLQVEYNKSRSQVVESKNRMARPQSYYEKGSLDPSKVTSEPGQMIPINPGFNYPKEKVLTPLPNYVFQEMEQTLRDMDELSGQTETDRGRTPPGIEAATAIAYLQEQNDTRMYHTVASIEDATSDVGMQLLSLVNEFVPHEQLVEIVSKNNTIEVEQFKSKSFTVATDFRVEAGSMAPKSAAAKQAFITDLMTRGIIPPEKGLRYLQLHETNRLYDELQIDSKQAQRENYMMSTGKAIKIDETTGQPLMNEEGLPVGLPVNLWDDHATHIYEHGLFLKSQEYELIQDPTIKTIIQLHYIDHKETELQAMQEEMMNGQPPVEEGNPNDVPVG